MAPAGISIFLSPSARSLTQTPPRRRCLISPSHPTLLLRRSLPRASSFHLSIGYLRVASCMKDGLFLNGSVIARASSSGISPSEPDNANKLLGSGTIKGSSRNISFIAKLAIALGIAVTITVLSHLSMSLASGVPFKYPKVAESSPQIAPAGFTFKLFSHKVSLPEYTPGWVYFWLLMAAGCGLFISEEALNVWVGITLARKLTLDGTWGSFAHSFSSNAPYIISTVLWVYWGVCISDMIPFYLGRLFRQTKASKDICSKLGIGKDRVISITRGVQKYGNLIGFVERFSIGVRNPTSFLAGAWGISADCFFAGVCFGGVFTLLIQMGVGFLLRDHPLMALASVATFVGVWSVFPYILAASTAMFLYFRRPQN